MSLSSAFWHRGGPCALILALACSSKGDTPHPGGGKGGTAGNDTQGGAGATGEAGTGTGGITATGGSGTGGGQAGQAGQTGQGGQAGSVAGAGGGGRGGAGGAPARGGGPGAMAKPTTCAGQPYCNDFETAPVGSRPQGNLSLTPGNKIAVTDTGAYSGSRSLLVEAAAGGDSRALIKFAVMDKLQSPMRVGYVRMMVWLENQPQGTGHWSVMGIYGPADGGATVGVYDAFVSYGGSGAQSRFLYGGGGSDCDKAGPPALPTGKWVCIEMKVDETAALPYGLSMDKVAVPALSFTPTKVGSGCFMPGTPMSVWYLPKPDTLGFGWQYWHMQVRPIRLWIDDIILDQKPIGCP